MKTLSILFVLFIGFSTLRCENSTNSSSQGQGVLSVVDGKLYYMTPADDADITSQLAANDLASADQGLSRGAKGGQVCGCPVGYTGTCSNTVSGGCEGSCKDTASSNTASCGWHEVR